MASVTITDTKGQTMKTLIATLLATAAGVSFAAAPTAALNHDPATYRNVTQKTNADYQAAVAKCDAKGGNDKDVCMAEARLARTRGEASALSQYNNTAAGRERARAGIADAEFAVAKARCDGKSGADKDSCMDNAKSVHTAALADAKNSNGTSATGASTGGALVAGTDTRDPAKAAAVDKCAQVGDAKTGCLVQTKPSPVRDNAAAAADNAADSARAAANAAAVKTRDAAATASDKTRAVVATAAEKTRDVAGTVVEKTKDVAATAGEKTDVVAAGATARTRIVAADTAITTKVKAGLLKEPKLESLGIHVETEKGTVMLSGFVNSKAEADKAVQVAKGVDGVATVKSAIQVK
jgi:hyperosmotically inducible protein